MRYRRKSSRRTRSTKQWAGAPAHLHHLASPVRRSRISFEPCEKILVTVSNPPYRWRLPFGIQGHPAERRPGRQKSYAWRTMEMDVGSKTLVNCLEPTWRKSWTRSDEALSLVETTWNIPSFIVRRMRIPGIRQACLGGLLRNTPHV
jgi:hypothetical protein